MEQVGQGTEKAAGAALGIYGALAQANRAIGSIGKNRKNKEQNFNFRGIDDVMNAVHSALSEAGVFILTEPEGDPKITERKTRAGGAIYHILQKWRFQFCAEDGSSITSAFWGEALDMGDKAMNKSSSIALKYVLLQLFLIPTEEQAALDPDGQSYETRPAQPLQQAQQAQPQQTIAQVADECYNRCKGFETREEFARLGAQMQSKFNCNRDNLPPIVLEAMTAGYNEWTAKQQQNAAEGSQQ